MRTADGSSWVWSWSVFQTWAGQSSWPLPGTEGRPPLLGNLGEAESSFLNCCWPSWCARCLGRTLEVRLSPPGRLRRSDAACSAFLRFKADQVPVCRTSCGTSQQACVPPNPGRGWCFDGLVHPRSAALVVPCHSNVGFSLSVTHACVLLLRAHWNKVHLVYYKVKLSFKVAFIN